MSYTELLANRFEELTDIGDIEAFVLSKVSESIWCSFNSTVHHLRMLTEVALVLLRPHKSSCYTFSFYKFKALKIAVEVRPFKAQRSYVS
jgi:hypothetical protein